MSWEVNDYSGWRYWVTPKGARQKAVHRWYLFPHSYTGDLVHSLIREWGLTRRDKVLDPFAGSGTTLLAAKEMAVPSDGFDLSPLAVLASNAKTATYSRKRLDKAWQTLETKLGRRRTSPMRHAYPELVQRSLSEGRLEALDAIANAIENTHCPRPERDFFRLALISIIPRFSHAVATGGWLRWLNQGASADNVTPSFRQQVEMMLSDVGQGGSHGDGTWQAHVADARLMPALGGTYSAVITSPPYPNRHDYTRVFGVELMFAFYGWEETRTLRYQTFHSHPEARPKRPSAERYRPPMALEESVRDMRDGRMRRMLEGYFLDMYLCLCEIDRVSKQGARIALVVGNARYNGKPLFVDEFTAEVGEQAGLRCKEIRAVRWRGNSAQQMGKYGRMPARESVVMFEKP